MNLKDFDWKQQWPITALLGLIVVLLLFLIFRGGDNSPSVEELLGTSQAMAGTSVAIQLTELAQIQPTATEALVTEASTPTTLPESTPTASDPDQACLSMVLTDENVPDGTVFQPGESFVKSWLLTNTGSCTWTEDYSLVFNRGDDMEAMLSTSLAGWVLPGESVWLSLDMIAPLQPGSHTGFWTLKAADGTIFGPAGSGAFYVQVAIAGPTPTSRARGFDPFQTGGIRVDGQPANELRTGDDTSNLDWQGLLTYKFGNLSSNATVTGAVLDLGVDYSINGDPFAGLGCLNVYISNYGGIEASDYGSAAGFALWTFCSEADMNGGARFGGPDAIQAVDEALFANQLQLIFVFEFENDADGVADQVITDPTLTVSFYDN